MANYVDIGAVRTWYETYGRGDPLVLLHGDLATTAFWGAQLDALAEHFLVLAPERRGHGHTHDLEGPFSYTTWAEEAARFLSTVVGGPAHLVGWSGGASVALLVALGRPELVRKLVLIGAKADVAGMVPEFEPSTRLPADSDAFQPFRALYKADSPDGEDHWPVVFDKVMHLWRTEPHIPLDDLARVASRTLVVSGDHDLVSLEHTIAIFRAIPDAELAIIPGTSHMAMMEKPDLVNRIIIPFLRRSPAPMMLPVPHAPTTSGSTSTSA